MVRWSMAVPVVMADGGQVDRDRGEPSWLAEYRHEGGGLSYLPGRSPRVESTAYAILAGVAAQRDADWLRGEVASSVAADATAPISTSSSSTASISTPARELTQHPWLLALATVALAQAGEHPDALFGDVVSRLGSEDVRASFIELFDKDEPDLAGSLPWRTPSYGWVEPTSWGLLAESGVLRTSTDVDIERRIVEMIPLRVAFLLSRLTKDGAWNYGNVTIMGVDLSAMPQTSAVCLVALAAAYETAAQHDIELPAFVADAPLARMLQLQEQEPSRLSQAWTQLALLSWSRTDVQLVDVPTHGPRPGESLVDAALTLVLERAKREQVVPMLGTRMLASKMTASRMARSRGTVS